MKTPPKTAPIVVAQLFAICVKPFIVNNDKNTAKILENLHSLNYTLGLTNMQ